MARVIRRAAVFGAVLELNQGGGRFGPSISAM